MCIFFFFQAEDGIRDIGVTGVQTCALPISAAVLDRGGTSSSNTSAAPATAPAAAAPRHMPLAAVKAIPRRAGNRGPKIGRASCRERVEISVVAGSLKKKNIEHLFT